MDQGLIKQRILAAHAILTQDTTDKARIAHLEQLLKGFNPRVDKHLSLVLKAYSQLEMIYKGDVVTLSAENLPDKTDSQKKHKKALLLLLGFWKQLHGEVDRVRLELNNNQTSSVSKWGRIIGLAKGPLGLVTIVAVGVVYLQSLSVKVLITNSGCMDIKPLSTLNIKIPGLSIPNETISNGEQVTAILPPLKFVVDASELGSIKLSGAGANYTFDNFSRGEILFDGTPISGRVTQIDLGSRKEHSLEIKCN